MTIVERSAKMSHLASRRHPSIAARLQAGGILQYFRERATSRSVAVTSASRRSAAWISLIREIVLPGVQSSKRCSAASKFRFASRTAPLAFAKSGVVGSIEGRWGGARKRQSRFDRNKCDDLKTSNALLDTSLACIGIDRVQSCASLFYQPLGAEDSCDELQVPLAIIAVVIVFRSAARRAFLALRTAARASTTRLGNAWLTLDIRDPPAPAFRAIQSSR